jgi:hypothetical protein
VCVCVGVGPFDYFMDVSVFSLYCTTIAGMSRILDLFFCFLFLFLFLFKTWICLKKGAGLVYVVAERKPRDSKNLLTVQSIMVVLFSFVFLWNHRPK